MEILDGTGKGYSAKVTNDNRLETFSITEQRVADISLNTGKGFLIASDFVSLTTTASFNGILYIKNTSDLNLFIDKIRTCSAATGSVQCRLIKNPTTGTLISDANAADKLSSNLGSSEIFGGDAFAASGDAKTVTDGDNLTQFINRSPGHSIQDYAGSVILQKGNSLAITCKPSASTDLCIEVQCWFE
jgi:hypothetical protein